MVRDDRLTRVEVETLRTLARPEVDWTNGKRADKGIRRLMRRGFAEPFGRQFPSEKPAGYRLTVAADEILARFGHAA